MKILLADDDVVARTFLTTALLGLGHDVLVAKDGEEAWATLSRQPVPVVVSDWVMPKWDGLELCRKVRNRPGKDYILRRGAADGDPFAWAILDMHMPDMHGLDLARAIKSDSTLCQTRLIILTSLGHALTPEERASDGIEDCLLKPVKQSNLFDCLARVLAGVSSTNRLDQEPDLGSANQAADSVVPGPTSPHANVKILVAEDNPINRRVALAQLQKLGYTADTAANGRETLEALQRISYDVVFMDCQMPELAAAVSSNSGPAVVELAHRLGGARSTCGMTAIVAPLRELERMATEGRLAEAGAALEKARHAYGRIRKSLQTLQST